MLRIHRPVPADRATSRPGPVPSSAPSRRRRGLLACAAACTLLGGSLVAAAPGAVASPGTSSATAAAAPSLAAAAPSLTVSTVASGLTIPWDVAFLPTGQMVVTERPGRIRVYADGAPGAALQRTVTVPSVRSVDESGLMGVAVDVDFRDHPYVYVCASRDYAGSNGWVNQLLRYTVSSGGSWSGPTVLRSGMAASNRHDGCSLEMDQSGYLWLGMGDAGVDGLAQDRHSLNGKILRLTRSGGVPSSNPVIAGSRGAVWSMGHRNPQGIALRPGTSEVWEVEHGPNTDDEVNRIVAGGNYGWPCYTGAGRRNATSTSCGAASAYRDPAWASGMPTVATSGATFVHGAQWADFAGDLVVPTLKDTELRRFEIAGSTTATLAQRLYDGAYGRLRAAVSGPGGDLYVTTSNGTDDRVLRIRPATGSVTRVGGADRYAAAAGISAATYPGGAREVYVASGLVFADALAAGPVAGRAGAPLLLTRDDTLPDATRRELQRLAPTRVTVVGGPPTVSDGVLDAIRGAVGGATVSRVGGDTRYDVAAALSRAEYPSGARTVFVTSGEVFTDALSAGPAAARQDAPLLLAGRRTLPAATATELQRLRPTRIYLVGGSPTVDDAVLARLRTYVSGTGAGVTRLAGADRYEVSRVVARTFWTDAAAVVTSGEVFPDGLSGGAAAAGTGRPVLLTGRDRLPPAVGTILLRLATNRVTVVGGTPSVGSAPEAALRRLVGSR
ncbi:PQQ-dependent sugar dehydrogenase [Phycicoccus sp. MAQZ13P-2]|uniref:PQQ-dependent sugar dehydrogenase n=1 Tax=Phycicoccus mangrovi TaxID=2840470 RepID=UPI001C000F7A|nr:PQQ-dependent sugar dehydrogenase [Phycicoccus mangrovi]MBT9256481.1 PQQ-dependent sugar dehydrogenase [Phycicoccus mangrovi]MBT9275130.1 PQQ-dependent sugar dehydrogenase [Phycicoccus mangrovi]